MPPRFLEHPNATNGVLGGNPVHAENLAIARRAPADFICDVTLDEARRLTGVMRKGPCVIPCLRDADA